MWWRMWWLWWLIEHHRLLCCLLLGSTPKCLMTKDYIINLQNISSDWHSFVFWILVFLLFFPYSLLIALSQLFCYSLLVP